MTNITIRGQFDCQIYSTAIRFPVSVIVANVVKKTIEEKLLKTFSHLPRLGARYVDDMSAIILKKHLKQFFNYLNLVETTKKFTLETKENRRIPFLDLLVIR